MLLLLLLLLLLLFLLLLLLLSQITQKKLRKLEKDYQTHLDQLALLEDPSVRMEVSTIVYTF